MYSKEILSTQDERLTALYSQIISDIEKHVGNINSLFQEVQNSKVLSDAEKQAKVDILNNRYSIYSSSMSKALEHLQLLSFYMNHYAPVLKSEEKVEEKTDEVTSTKVVDIDTPISE